jgi:CheY-specific phosphatase CheX
MQTTDRKLQLAEAASDVLESMYFLSVLGSVDEPIETDASWIWVRLTFSGDGEGSFGLGCPSGTAWTIAGNFLGQTDEEITSEQVEEVICELSNMICGSFLGRFRNGSLFDLSHPACEANAVHPLAPASSSVSAQTLELDEGMLHVWLEFAE